MMLQGISNTIGSLPIASIGCTAAGLYIGRKWCLTAVYKFGSLGASIIASKKSQEWNEVSNEYWTRAKKNTFRDLTAATGLIALGLASGFAEKKVVVKDEPVLFHTLGNYGWSLAKTVYITIPVTAFLTYCGLIAVLWASFGCPNPCKDHVGES